MADLNRYLRRFWRLVSPPGRLGPAAVPADRARTISAELARVLEAIDAVETEGNRILEDAAQQAQQRRDEAEDEARRILADASARIEQARDEAHASHRRDLHAENEAALAAARHDADAVRARAGENVEALAERIVGQLLEPESEEAVT